MSRWAYIIIILLVLASSIIGWVNFIDCRNKVEHANALVETLSNDNRTLEEESNRLKSNLDEADVKLAEAKEQLRTLKRETFNEIWDAKLAADSLRDKIDKLVEEALDGIGTAYELGGRHALTGGGIGYGYKDGHLYLEDKSLPGKNLIEER